MLYFVMQPGGVLVCDDHAEAAVFEADGYRVKCRHNLETFEAAEELAAKATKDAVDDVYLPVDQGGHHYPRYDVVRAPKVGDKVSKGFNGDYYPCGTITKVSKTFWMVETDTDKVFYRRKKTGSWLLKGGTWSMVKGHVDERNPHF